MNHGSLFSGIGGFDLAAEWMGWNNLFHCEWNPFGQKVLKHYWPEAESFNDITKTDFTQYANRISILTGGFPCQPYSSAGKRKGKDDERHLWPHMLRAIREIRPRWVVGENVLGLVNWSGGLVFHEVQADLEAEGYEVQPFLLPAAAVNAPHRRDRIYFVAHATGSRNRQQQRNNFKQQNRQFTHNGEIRNATDTDSGGYRRGSEQSKSNQSKEWKICQNKQQHRHGIWCEVEGRSSNATNTDSNGQHECNCNDEINASERGINAQCDIEQSVVNGNSSNTKQQGLFGLHKTGYKDNFNRENSKIWRSIAGHNKKINNYVTDPHGFRLRRESNGPGKSGFTCKNQSGNNWQTFPTESPVCGGNDGLPTKLDGITFSKWRNESIKGYGNAIVPQVVFQIFKTIQEYENSLSLQ